MNDIKAMAWKEWHEVRAFLWIGLGVFLGLPVIGGLESLIQNTGRFELRATPTILATLFGFGSYGDFSLKNGLVYMSESSYRGLTNPHVDVFDARGAGEIRAIGHFAAPGVHVVYPLPDGRALVGGTKLWLVGPPPKRG